MRTTVSVAILLASVAACREIPSNLKSFYSSHKNVPCANPLSIKYSSGQGNADTVYCKDNASGAVFLKDTSKGYADADIDCDGTGMGTGDCGNDPSGQSMTAFQDLVREYSGGAVKDLNTHIHNFVVLGNDNSPEEGDGGKSFDPQSANIKPLSVVAVVCGQKLVYGVWGDVNGGKLTGETSLSLAKQCFPNEDLNGDSGHGDHDVLYMAFPGEEAVAKNVKWGASTAKEFEASLATIGDKLVKKVAAGKANSRIMRARV